MAADTQDSNSYFQIFDCDGVILDSNGIKTEAFRHALLAEEPSQVEALVEYHLSNGGIDRREKLLYYYREIAGRDPVDDIEESIRRFSDFCRSRLLEAPLIPGIREYLAQNQVCQNFVVSGGTQDELDLALGHQKLKQHFVMVLGSPKSKRENMGYLEEAGYLKGEGIYFGDSRLDMELAGDFRQRFVFVAGASDWQRGAETCEALGHAVIVDFRGLSSPR